MFCHLQIAIRFDSTRLFDYDSDWIFDSDDTDMFFFWSKRRIFCSVSLAGSEL